MSALQLYKKLIRLRPTIKSQLAYNYREYNYPKSMPDMIWFGNSKNMHDFGIYTKTIFREIFKDAKIYRGDYDEIFLGFPDRYDPGVISVSNISYNCGKKFPIFMLIKFLEEIDDPDIKHTCMEFFGNIDNYDLGRYIIDYIAKHNKDHFRCYCCIRSFAWNKNIKISTYFLKKYQEIYGDTIRRADLYLFIDQDDWKRFSKILKIFGKQTILDALLGRDAKVVLYPGSIRVLLFLLENGLVADFDKYFDDCRHNYKMCNYILNHHKLTYINRIPYGFDEKSPKWIHILQKIHKLYPEQLSSDNDTPYSRKIFDYITLCAINDHDIMKYCAKNFPISIDKILRRFVKKWYPYQDYLGLQVLIDNSNDKPSIDTIKYCLNKLIKAELWENAGFLLKNYAIPYDDDKYKIFVCEEYVALTR